MAPRTSGTNNGMESLLRAGVYGKQASAPWHGLAQIGDVCGGNMVSQKSNSMANVAPRKNASAKKATRSLKSWSVVEEEDQGTIKRS